MPPVSVVSVLLNPVAGLRAVTLAPGIAAPWGSTTRPVTVPVDSCAPAKGAEASSQTSPVIRVVFMCDSAYVDFGAVHRSWGRYFPFEHTRLSVFPYAIPREVSAVHRNVNTRGEQ